MPSVRRAVRSRAAIRCSWASSSASCSANGSCPVTPRAIGCTSSRPERSSVASCSASPACPPPPARSPRPPRSWVARPNSATPPRSPGSRPQRRRASPIAWPPPGCWSRGDLFASHIRLCEVRCMRIFPTDGARRCTTARRACSTPKASPPRAWPFTSCLASGSAPLGRGSGCVGPGAAGAVQRLCAAAAEATVRAAPDAAVVFLRRALEEPPTTLARPGVLRALGVAEGFAQDPAAAAHLRPALAGVDDVRERATIALDLARVQVPSGQVRQAVESLDGAIAALGGLDAELSLRLEATLIGAALSKRELQGVAHERLRRVGDPPRGDTA